MRYDIVKKLSDEEFRRLTGVKRDSFERMLNVLEESEAERLSCRRYKGGRKPKLSLENKLLIALEYWREYRTQFHIAQSYGVSEASICIAIRYVEDVLIKSGEFSLPGKKALLESDIEWETVVIDATETPIERPKKNSVSSTPERRNATH